LQDQFELAKSPNLKITGVKSKL